MIKWLCIPVFLQLPQVPADVALSSAIPPLDTKDPYTVNVTHDHMDLYENSADHDMEPKKLYRCDRCPYANVRRDHLLSHLKFHMLKCELQCPYCDYSVAKQHLLTQHIKVHFSPLPELSNWLVQNGQMDRVEESKEPDISEAIKVAELLQTESKEKKADAKGDNLEKGDNPTPSANDDSDNDKEVKSELILKNEEAKVKEPSTGETTDTDKMDTSLPCQNSPSDEEVSENRPDIESSMLNGDVKSEDYVCQYCDREFVTSDILVRHEMQHLIGNNFEVRTIRKYYCKMHIFYPAKIKYYTVKNKICQKLGCKPG